MAARPSLLWRLTHGGIGAGVVAAAILAVAALSVSRGCDESTGAEASVATVRLGGRTFHLELALDDPTRFRGLSGRTHIEPDGGMLFVFPRPVNLYFVMRDCPIPIDIVFLDGNGRVIAMHEMVPEPPRTEEEKVLTVPAGSPSWAAINESYERRLKRYPSRFDAQFVIEVAGGTLRELSLKPGDRVELDAASLKARAR